MEIKLDEGYYEQQADKADTELDRAKEARMLISEKEHREMYPWFYRGELLDEKWRDT